MDVRPEEVAAFWRFMQDFYGTSAVKKTSALEMQLVARALDALGIQRKDRFLKNFTTTVGRRIYTPFEIGSPQGGWDFWQQIVICVHEHQHVVQRDREGLAYELSYLIDPSARAGWEVEAYRCNLELQFWRTGTMPSSRRIAEFLRDYGCTEKDVDVAAKSLALSAISVRRGAILSEATHVALGWLSQHLPHLRK